MKSVFVLRDQIVRLRIYRVVWVIESWVIES